MGSTTPDTPFPCRTEPSSAGQTPQVSLEDSVPQEEAARILRRKYPRPVKVRLSRRNGEKSRCVYL